MISRKLVFILVFCVYSLLPAQPLIQNISGNVIHNYQIFINGNSFGVKDPASPLVWDDCTNDVPLEIYYDQWLPTNAEQGSYYNMAYRNVPFRNLGSPIPRINYILAGAHAVSHHFGTYNSGGNVGLGKNLTSFNFFIQYWYRIDPLFDLEAHPTAGDNMKEIDLSATENSFYTGDHGYLGWCGNTIPTINFTNPIRLGRMPVDCPNLPYACSNDQFVVFHQNPINDWVKMQWEGGYNNLHDNPTVKLTTYPDGVKTALSHYGTEITTSDIYVGCGYPNAGELRFIGIGGFARVERENNGQNSFRYFAGIYIDNTPARIMLGDNSDYDSCTIMEPQIPVSWSNNTISCLINLGAFPDTGNAYMFIINSEGQRNSPGFPITIGGTVNQPPAKPQNLQVMP
jgi:hypothetical protein